MTESVLEGVAGLGPTRRARLMEEFATIGAIRNLTREDLRAVDWLPEAVADALFERLHPSRASGAPDGALGEADS